jgi:hypothetical protein
MGHGVLVIKGRINKTDGLADASVFPFDLAWSFLFPVLKPRLLDHSPRDLHHRLDTREVSTVPLQRAGEAF